MRGADHTVLIAWLAVGGAILAALIAAVSADIRQRRQLRHDRQLQDLTELRSVLDKATVAFEETITALQFAFSGLIAGAAADDDAGEVDADAGKADDFAKAAQEAQRILEGGLRQQYNDDMKKCAETRDRMIVAGQRMAIRIGDDQPVNATYQVAIRMVIDTIRHIGVQKDKRNAGTRLSSEDFKERNIQLGRVRTVFVIDAVALVGSRLPQRRKRKLALPSRRRPLALAAGPHPADTSARGGEDAKHLSDEPDGRDENRTPGDGTADNDVGGDRR
jgi:hypothetical protein